MNTVTLILRKIDEGDPDAEEKLYKAVYEELCLFGRREKSENVYWRAQALPAACSRLSACW